MASLLLISELTELLALERASGRDLEDTIASLTANLNDAESERDRLAGLLDASSNQADQAGGAVATLETALDAEKRISQRALSQVELLNQQISALRRQIGALESALEASESRDRESQTKIADLGRRLNVALAQRSEVLFSSGEDTINPAGEAELKKLADAVKELAVQIPDEINWGVDPERLVAAGFGEFQPLEEGDDPERSPATAGSS
eukprot:jgi/Tetstr1/422044/TSEL_012908.t1